MHRSIGLLILVLGLMTLPGCISNVSRHEPFRQYVGQTVHLQKRMWLFEWRPGDWAFHDFSLRDDGRPYDRERLLAVLDRGTPLKIRKVLLKIGDGAMMSVYASTVVPQTGKTVNFTYHWPYHHGLGVLYRACWESADVPEERYVGQDGKSYVASIQPN